MATPASLMRPRAPKAGKRVFLEYIRPVWRRLTFTWKVTMRNLFRYQRRFWMTVIGIGGCTALIVTGFVHLLHFEPAVLPRVPL
jgi:putative ABC transport system permease protein